MPLDAGSENADSGMSSYLYQAIEDNLKSSFPDGPSEELKQGWKKLAFALADGLVKYINTELSIIDITVGEQKQLEILYSADDGNSYKAEIIGSVYPGAGGTGG